MDDLPECEFLRPHSNEFSPADNLKFMGELYAGQTEAVCGGRSVGAVLQFFSHKSMDVIMDGVRRCCHNKRAGEMIGMGRVVPDTNARAAKSLLCLIAMGRRHPLIFKHHKVAITVPTEEIRAAIQNL